MAINNEWEEIFNKSIEKHIDDLSNMECLNSIDKDEDLESIYETIVYGYGQAHAIDDLDNRIIQIAPSKGLQPLSFFQDRFF